MFSINVPENRITFGAKDSNTQEYPAFKRGMTLLKVDDKETFWQVDLSDAKYGDNQISAADSKKVFFDTGVSYNMIPQNDLKNIMF